MKRMDKIKKTTSKKISKIKKVTKLNVEHDEKNKEVVAGSIAKGIAEEKKSIFEILKNKIFLRSVLVVVFLGLLGVSGYFYYQYRKVTAIDIGKNEVAVYVSKINKLILLPEGEEPAMATVRDKDKLSNQLFFTNAQNDDKVLIYTKAQKAILYRPAINKIIEVVFLTSSNQIAETSTQQETGQVSQMQQEVSENQQDTKREDVVVKDVRVAIYNGANIKGLAKDIADKISGISGIEVSNKSNALKNYKSNIVIDFSQNNGEITQKIIETIGGESGELPAGETEPDADILIIAGQ